MATSKLLPFAPLPPILCQLHPSSPLLLRFHPGLFPVRKPPCVVARPPRLADGLSPHTSRLLALENLRADPSDRTLDGGDGDGDRAPFNVNLAVVLAGFAFEAYNTPSDISRVLETDPYDCKTIFLSEPFVGEIYEGQFIIKLKRGSKLPGLDLWGTSDPYVVLRIGECVVRSKTVWATTEPVWDESFKINVANPSTQYLQIAAWDANLVTEHRRLGNSGLDLQPFSDGEMHVVEVLLEGMGGGGAITLEVQYQRFEAMKTSEKGWNIPFLSAFLQSQKFEDVFNNSLDSLTVNDFLRSVLGSTQEKPKETVLSVASSQVQKDTDDSTRKIEKVDMTKSDMQKVQESDIEDQLDNKPSNEEFLQFLRKGINETLGVNLDGPSFPSLDSVNWDALDVIKNLGLASQNKAKSQYVESGLVIETIEKNEASAELSDTENTAFSTEELKKVTTSLLKQTEETLKKWTVLSTSLTQCENELADTTISKEIVQSEVDSSTSNEKLKELEEARKMFAKAESAMEAWAVLATSLGHKSFVKSAFEKLCFLDNSKTDTQVAIWRDVQHRRLVVAFRGTEQVKWKDIRTDLMLLPVSFNPERVGGEFNQEEMIHGGFLSAYDSVRNRLMSLLKASIGFSNAQHNTDHPWQVYVTGHSLGGALATLFALELSASKLSSQGFIKVSMYNFGSPRVGNRKFAERYNEIVKDSWRVVNHRDIIPTVPRLMGYCHVAQPIYLMAGDVYDANVSMELSGDGYHADVIGEATPDFLLEEFMKGEKSLLSKLLQTEIAMFRAIRDGSALMQHMEDFYYISLLESVSSKLPTVERYGKQ